MIVTKEDVHDRSGSIIVEGAYVRELVRCFRVEGFPPGAPPVMLYQQAVTASGLPAPWATCPGLENLRAIRYAFEPDTPHSGYVTVTYLNTTPRFYKGGAGLTSYETFEDINGAKIELTYKNDTKVFPIVVPASEHVLIAERLEPSILVPGGIDPENIANQFQNRVNSQPIAGLSGGAGTWLMEDVGYDNHGLGDIAWMMTYTLRNRPWGWQPRAAYLKKDGTIPTDVVEGLGARDITWHLSIDINDLDLT